VLQIYEACSSEVRIGLGTGAEDIKISPCICNHSALGSSFSLNLRPFVVPCKAGSFIDDDVWFVLFVSSSCTNICNRTLTMWLASQFTSHYCFLWSVCHLICLVELCRSVYFLLLLKLILYGILMSGRQAVLRVQLCSLWLFILFVLFSYFF
jgi:hypothetical protein